MNVWGACDAQCIYLSLKAWPAGKMQGLNMVILPKPSPLEGYAHALKAKAALK